MIYPLVRELAADHIPVAVTCRVLGFSKQAFYAWNANPIPQRDWDDAHLINAAIDIHHDDPAFGYRFIADELRERGIAAGENRVARLCSQQRLWSIFARKRGLNRKVGPPVHDDLVDRRFTAPAANAVWLTDITEHPTTEGKLYLCAIKDVHSSRIVGYSMDARMTASLAVTALRNAIALRAPAGTIVHSDRGSQGGFSRSSQHLVVGGVVGDDARAAASGAAVSGAGPVSRSADRGLAGGPRALLDGHRARGQFGGCGGRGRCVAGGRRAVVPKRWRRDAEPAAVRVGSLHVLRGEGGHRHLARSEGWCPRDRSPPGSCILDGLAGAATQRLDADLALGVPGVDGAMACRAQSSSAQGLEACRR